MNSWYFRMVMDAYETALAIAFLFGIGFHWEAITLLGHYLRKLP